MLLGWIVKSWRGWGAIFSSRCQFQSVSKSILSCFKIKVFVYLAHLCDLLFLWIMSGIIKAPIKVGVSLNWFWKTTLHSLPGFLHRVHVTLPIALCACRDPIRTLQIFQSYTRLLSSWYYAVIHFSQYQKHVSHLLNQHTQHSHKAGNWFLSFLHFYYDEIAQLLGQKYFLCAFFNVLRKQLVNTYFCREVKRQ